MKNNIKGDNMEKVIIENLISSIDDEIKYLNNCDYLGEYDCNYELFKIVLPLLKNIKEVLNEIKED
jgi:hypothetical protein